MSRLTSYVLPDAVLLILKWRGRQQQPVTRSRSGCVGLAVTLVNNNAWRIALFMITKSACAY